ncbi:SDR family oxidoreductase [Blautia sp. AF13-16]|nr:KR domain-containing protein [Blautia producta]RHP79842.1 SDR family oxidoreductase [Blautia sp. OF01-4LB]RHS14128.1 SDR family oxidoreductase [Blautia sp. AF13-16]
MTVSEKSASYLDKLFGLEGRTAVVTGGNRGIGQVVARGLASAGAEVVVISRSGGAETVKLILEDGNKAYDIKADVTDEKSVDRAVEEIEKRSGGIHVLFNNAGICIHKSTFEASIEEFRQVVDVNLTGEYIMARSAARLMVQKKIHGSIINMASMSGTIVNIPQWQASYNASKAGVIHLTKSLALEWIPYGIRVNSLSPGYISTPMSVDTPQELKDAWKGMMPYGRMGTPEELIGAVLYLAGDSSAYTTGTDLIVDGAYVCQ